jgi:hypothetical protein
MRWITIAIAAAVQVACTDRAPDPQIVSLHGVSYRFPQRDIESFVSETQGTLFARLRGRGSDFDLILDELSHYAPNKQGGKIPTISRLNDNRFAAFQVMNDPDGPVICGDAMPHFNCGFRIDDGPVRWSVLFDRGRLGQVKRIRAQAEAAIRSYRAPA